MMRMEANSTAALDALCSPGSIIVSLQRCVRYTTRSKKARVAESVETVATAAWWLSASSQSTSKCRFMEGELALSKDMRSSSDIGTFSVSVSSNLVPECRIAYCPQVLCRPQPV